LFEKDEKVRILPTQVCCATNKNVILFILYHTCCLAVHWKRATFGMFGPCPTNLPTITDRWKLTSYYSQG